MRYGSSVVTNGCFGTSGTRQSHRKKCCFLKFENLFGTDELSVTVSSVLRLEYTHNSKVCDISGSRSEVRAYPERPEPSEPSWESPGGLWKLTTPGP